MLPWRRRRDSKAKSRQLFDQEFSLVKEGLAVEEVEQLVNNLLAKHRADLEQQPQQREQPKEPRPAPVEPLPYRVAKQIVSEAERDAATIRAKARQETEVETARLVAEARQRAETIVEDSKKQAREAAEQEALSVLDAANQRAALTESQAIQMAHLFLIRAREEVRDRLAIETKESYQRLLASLQELQRTSQAVETEWLTKKIEPWWGQPSELKDFQATLLASLMTGATSSDVPALERVGQEPQAQPGPVEEAAPPSREEAPAPEPATIPKVEAQPSSQPAQTAARTPATFLSGATAPLLAREEAVTEESSASAAAQEAPAEPTAELESKPVESQALEPPTEEAQTEAEETAAETPIQEKEVSAPEKEGPDADNVPDPRLSSGETEIVITPPIRAARITEIYGHLQSMPDLKILRTSGSWDHGTVVTVTLNRPIPLVEMLRSGIPQAVIRREAPRGGALRDRAERGRTTERVIITFRDQDTER